MFKLAPAGLSFFHIEVLNMKNYYGILGVSPKATPKEIKEAYRRIATMTHPDTHPDDAAAVHAFKRATEAYGVLSNAQRRELYDKAIAPVVSVSDLFLRRKSGRDFLETVLPSAPAAYQRGADEFLAQDMPPIVDGKIRLSFDKPNAKALVAYEIGLPREARSWLRLDRCGAVGKNGGENGDLYVFLLPVPPATTKTQKRRTTTLSGRKS
jgi:curved DNA-binding protein CbpA